VDPDDLLEALIGAKPQRERPLRIEILRPAADDAHDRGIRLAPDEARDLLASDLAQRFDLLGHRRAHARHAQVAPRAELRAVDFRSMK